MEFLEALVRPFLYGLGILAILALARAWYHLLRRRVRGSATIVAITGSSSYRSKVSAGHPMVDSACMANVEFFADGRRHSFTFTFLKGQHNFRVGQLVTVIYDPANPANATVDVGPAKYTELVVVTSFLALLLLLHWLGF